MLLGLPSTGLHTNGYSLARKLLFEVANYAPDTYVKALGCTAAEELLKVHRSYLRPLQLLAREKILKGAAHITGGGITGNTPRVLPKGLGAEIKLGSWPVPAVFEHLKELGNVPDDDYRRTFNLGIGMILVVGQGKAGKARRMLEKLGEVVYEIGRVVALRPRTAARVIYKK